jgi:hypothetical protein
MTHEEKLDFILVKMKGQRLPVTPRMFETASWSFVDNNFDAGELMELIVSLWNDKYVWTNDRAQMFEITTNGRVFIDDGGYVAKKKREQELHHQSKESLRVAKTNTNWVKIGAWAAIIAAILAGISLFFQMYSSK